jgi:two-component system invasion response regulator UvrY
MPDFLVIDDHPVVRRGIREILEEMKGKVNVDEAGTAAGGLKKVQTRKYDMVLLDIKLPDRSGLDTLENIRHLKPGLPVLIISVYPEEQYAVRALKTGASGYLTKESAPDELIHAVHTIMKGNRYITQSIAEQIFTLLNHDGPLHSSLSNREYEVMIQIAKGKSLKEIGEILFLSEKTISTYRTRIMEKMNMKSNAELVKYALQNMLIE